MELIEDKNGEEIEVIMGNEIISEDNVVKTWERFKLNNPNNILAQDMLVPIANIFETDVDKSETQGLKEKMDNRRKNITHSI